MIHPGIFELLKILIVDVTHNTYICAGAGGVICLFNIYLFNSSIFNICITFKFQAYSLFLQLFMGLVKQSLALNNAFKLDQMSNKHN